MDDGEEDVDKQLAAVELFKKEFIGGYRGVWPTRYIPTLRTRGCGRSATPPGTRGGCVLGQPHPLEYDARY